MGERVGLCSYSLSREMRVGILGETNLHEISFVEFVLSRCWRRLDSFHFGLRYFLIKIGSRRDFVRFDGEHSGISSCRLIFV